MKNQKLLSFGDTPYASPYYSVGREECVNLYVEKSITASSKVPSYYVKIPGLKMFVPQKLETSCRGLYRSSDQRLFGVFGNRFEEILRNGQRLQLGTLESYGGTVSIVDNTHQVLIVDGVFGYILEMATNTFSKIDENVFPNGSTHCDCIDTFFLTNVPNSINYRYSAPNNGLSWDPLDFSSKEGNPDNIVAIKGLSNQLWVFGSYSTEVHYDAGDIATQIWQRYEGAVIDVGCTHKNSIARLEGNIFWVGSDKAGNTAVWTNEGLIPKKISTRGIEQLIQEFAKTDLNAIGWTYAQSGHVFYGLTFNEGNITLVYDLTTGTWHRRMYTKDGGEYRWRGVYTAFCWGYNLFGDISSDCIYESNVDYYLNDLPDGTLNQIWCKKTTPVIQINQKRVRHNSCQIVFEQGVGLTYNNQLNNGADPVVQLWSSDDSGINWPSKRQTQIGRIGEYAWRSIFRMLGHSRNRVYQVIVTDPVKVILVGFVLDLVELES